MEAISIKDEILADIQKKIEWVESKKPLLTEDQQTAVSSRIEFINDAIKLLQSEWKGDEDEIFVYRQIAVTAVNLVSGVFTTVSWSGDMGLMPDEVNLPFTQAGTAIQEREAKKDREAKDRNTKLQKVVHTLQGLKDEPKPV